MNEPPAECVNDLAPLCPKVLGRGPLATATASIWGERQKQFQPAVTCSKLTEPKGAVPKVISYLLLGQPYLNEADRRGGVHS
jgi:hypothetical protein